MKRLFDRIDEWKIVQDKIEFDENRLAESIMSIGNGYMGMRGNYEEKYSGDSHQGSYIGGVWFPDKTRVGWWKNGYPNYFGKVPNSINFIGINVYVNDVEIDLNKCEVLDFYRELDMHSGVLTRTYKVKIDENIVCAKVTRFLSVVKKEMGLIKYEVNCSQKSKVKFESYLHSDVCNEDSNYDEKFWINIDTKSRENEGFVSCKTKENPFGTEVFTVCAYMKNNISKDSLEYTYNNEDYLANNSYTFEIDENESVYLEKFVSVVTSRDFNEEDINDEAKKILDIEFEKGFEKCLDEHSKSWNERFNICDIKISGDKLAQQGIRYNLFQLLSTYSGEDSRLNIGPKGFTGEKYGGATYWDTEAYCLPVYLGTSKSEVSRNLLIYRYNQLEKAKENSKKLGLKGALYPMVTFNGEECHNEWEITFEEIHRNASIVYGIYNYTNYTGDTSYISEYGIDVIVEVARFFASRVHLSTRKNIYMMHGVTGPNEYENNVNNNWYTNFMGKWCLEYASENIKNLNSKDINDRLQISDLEVNTWDEVASKMYLPYDEELDIIVQHDNFLDKEFIEVKDLDKNDLPINQKWSWDKILRSCFIKQADVLQGIYYFLEKFSETEIKNNFDFYEKYTVHESSLSSSIYSIIASQIGYLDKAYELYSRTARLDLDNYNNDTEDGLHITSMSGAWISIVQGFAGMRTFSTLEFSPKLPTNWEGYSFNINYRENIINIEVSSDKVIITNIKGNEIKLKVYDNEYCVIDKIEFDRI